MRNKKIAFAALLLTFTLCQSCDKDCLNNKLTGEWNWYKSEGGFTGGTFFPEDFGYNETLVIDDYYFKKLINDTLVFERQYDLETYLDSVYGESVYIVYSGGGKEKIEISWDHLIIMELDDDGYTRYYIRKKI